MVCPARSHPVDGPPRRRPTCCRAVAVLGTLVAATVAVARAGTALPPPRADLATTADWVRAVGAPAASMAVVRVLVMVVLAWLIVTTAAALAARVIGSARAIRWTEVLLSPAQRRLLGAGFALTVTVAHPAASLATPADGPAPVIMTVVDESTPEPTATTTTTAGIDAPRVDADGSTSTTTTPSPTTTAASPRPSNPPPSSSPATDTPTGAAPASAREAATTRPVRIEIMTIVDPDGPEDPAVADRQTAPAVEVSSTTTWTIRPGDHLWAVARETLRAHGLDASDSAAAAYLDSLIELNRDVLAVPGAPDLVFPGQVFALPALPDR